MTADKVFNSLQHTIGNLSPLETCKLAAMLLNEIDGVSEEEFNTFWNELNQNNQGEIQSRIYDLEPEE